MCPVSVSVCMSAFFVTDRRVEFVEASTLTGAGVDDAKNKACEMLLKHRVEQKQLAAAALGVVTPGAGGVKTAGGGGGPLENRLFVTQVANPRKPFIPQSVLDAQAQQQAVRCLPIYLGFVSTRVFT